MTPPPIRFRHLSAASRSAAHARLALTGDDDADTSAIERGAALHAMLFETRRVLAYPGAVRRGKEWEAFRDQHASDLILTASDYERASRMAEAVHRNHQAAEVLQGTREHSLTFQRAGRECMATPDVAAYTEFVTELKSTRDADPHKFTWQALRYRYVEQLSWYVDAVAAAGLGRPRDAFVVAVESSAPYPVTVLRLTERALERGRKNYTLWWERLIGAERSGVWPEYAQHVVDLDVPDDDLELDFGSSESAAAEAL